MSFKSLLFMKPTRQEEMLRGHPKKTEKLWARDWLWGQETGLYNKGAGVEKRDDKSLRPLLESCCTEILGVCSTSSSSGRGIRGPFEKRSSRICQNGRTEKSKNVCAHHFKSTLNRRS